MLDEDAEKAFDGAIQRAVHHQRLMRLAVFADVFELEAARESEIELHGGELPWAADGIHQLDVDLRPVERGFVGHHFHFDVETLGGVLERVFGDLPLLGRAVVFAAQAVVPGGKLGFIFVETESGERIDGELKAVHDFVFDLLGCAEDVRVILREAAHAEQAVEHAGALIAVDRAQLAQAHRQIAVAVLLILINQDVEGAVHRLELVFGVVQLHAREHVGGVKIGVAGGLPEIEARHVRRVHQRVAAPQILVAHPVFELLADDAALGMEEDKSRPGQLLNAEQVEILAELAMVALLGFLDLLEMRVELFGGEKSGAVNALQLLILLTALPVSAGDGEQLEGLDLRSVRQVRAAAEIDEMRSQRVFAEDLVGLFINQFALHPGVGVFLQAVFLASVDALIGKLARLDLPHLLFDFLEVVGGERNGAVEVVIETVVDGRPDAELGLRVQFEHGSGQQVRGGMAVDV